MFDDGKNSLAAVVLRESFLVSFLVVVILPFFS
jgi:hypothetical protein